MKTSFKRMLGSTLTAGAFALAIAAAPASAAYLQFFGEDLNNSAAVPLAATPNSNAAQAAFLSNLVGVGTETFEGIAPGTGQPLALNFGAAGNATLSGGGGVVSSVAPGSTNGFGRYAISGSNFWEVTAGAGGDFLVSFTNPVAAFGFFGVDIGDFGGTVTLTLANGLNTVINVPHTVGAGGNIDGSVIYFGIIGTTVADTFTSVAFNTTLGQVGAGETFAFDDMTIGSLQQVRIPEPGTLALLGLALAGLGFSRRRKA